MEENKSTDGMKSEMNAEVLEKSCISENEESTDCLEPEMDFADIDRAWFCCGFCNHSWEVYDPETLKEIRCPRCKLELAQIPTAEEIAEANLRVEEWYKWRECSMVLWESGNLEEFRKKCEEYGFSLPNHSLIDE